MKPLLQCRCIEWSPEEGCCLKRKVVTISHQLVTSSNLYSVGYHEPDLILEVTFHKDGTPTGTYRYLGISRERYEALLAAESVGSYFAQHIKGKYDCTKIEEIQTPCESK
jgi:hypothetical protein